MHLPPHLKPKATKYIGTNPDWTVYNLASHLGVKARDLYLELDLNARLLLIKQGRMLAKHATEGLFPLAEIHETEQKQLKIFGPNKTNTPSKRV